VSSWSDLTDFWMKYGHIPILGGLLWIGVALHKAGVKMTFDVRIWKNGKKEEKKEL
jgi:hypothetical protein